MMKNLIKQNSSQSQKRICPKISVNKNCFFSYVKKFLGLWLLRLISLLAAILASSLWPGTGVIGLYCWFGCDTFISVLLTWKKKNVNLKKKTKIIFYNFNLLFIKSWTEISRWKFGARLAFILPILGK